MKNAGSIFLRFGELGVIYVYQAQFLFSFWFLLSHQMWLDVACLKSSVKAQLSKNSTTVSFCRLGVTLISCSLYWVLLQAALQPTSTPVPQFHALCDLIIVMPFVFLFPSEGILVLISLPFGFPWMYMRGSQNGAKPKLWTFKKEKGKELFISWPFVFGSSTNKYRLCSSSLSMITNLILAKNRLQILPF